MTRAVGYYFLHTFFNSIRKLFRTWFAIYLAICIIFGAAVGLGAGVLFSSIEKDASQPEQGQTQEDIEQTEEPAELIPEEGAEKQAEWGTAILEMATGAVVLAWLLISVYTSEKGSMNIFTMPDVYFLFTAPVKPQSVLLFRVLLQMGLTLISTVYIAFQIPNFVMNLGMDPNFAAVLLLLWVFVLILGKLLSVFTYTLTATHPQLQRYVRPLVYLMLLILFAAYGGLVLLEKHSYWEAAQILFASPWQRLIPVIGWAKGLAVYIPAGQILPAALCAAGLAASVVLFAWLIWRMKADFYEDAMESAAKQQALIEAANAGKQAKSKKRPEKIRREGELYGRGCGVFFTKTLYVRRRMAKFGIFSGTGLTYLFLCLLTASALRFFFHYENLNVVAGILLMAIFIRNYNSPIAGEIGCHYLAMAPDSAVKKLGCVIFSGNVECLLDLLPGFLLAALLLQASPLPVLLWLLLFITLDFFASAAGLFIEMLMPAMVVPAIRTAMAFMIKAVVSMLGAGLLIAAGVMLSLPVGIFLAVAWNLLLGIPLFFLGTLFLHTGRR